ncbi:hypothetical protein CC86DRAFT_463001 [Ophiobolus disseminans]|uniref:Uncharacterized protein n=1 Tax=Ophiobolus disseminans TaxID=1469910 RepID=A0A6A7ACE5_9PLEO|nr:hypothetical protein CC86DRAFT_463001 [Ophiobolus disseminans]
MAPRKPTNKAFTLPTGTSKDTAAGVTKRRYKKVRFFENGLLDVERKTGKFLKIARQNQQDSPLLKLPPEIRHEIFRHAIGERICRIKYIHTLGATTKHSKPARATTLLTTWRQLYAETALLPWAQFTIDANDPNILSTWLNQQHPAHRELITKIRFRIDTIICAGTLPGHMYDADPVDAVNSWVLPYLRSLHTICVAMTEDMLWNLSRQNIRCAAKYTRDAVRAQIELMYPGVEVVAAKIPM